MTNDRELRLQLTNLLIKRQAHMLFEDAIADFPAAAINTPLTNADYTFWHLVEHLRLAQRDILDYCVAGDSYKPLAFPDGYWPTRTATADEAGWQTSIAQFLANRQALVDLINDDTTDLFAQLPHGAPGHNVLREIAIIGQHNAYHVGELGVMRQTMGLWPS